MTKTLCNDFRAGLPFSCSSIVLKCWHLYQALIAFALIVSFGVEVAKYYKLTNIGAVFEVTSSVRKEEKPTMEIAVQDFNISLFMNPGRDPLKAPITEMNMWEEGASVAAIGNHAPMLSYAASSAPPTQSSLGQPFLTKLTINDFEHGKCFATIIHVYRWSRDTVIPIFEEEAYVVFILEPGYTARVSSILTFQQLEPDITDIERLKKANSKIEFAGDSFVRTYFEKVLGFEKQNIEDDSSKYKYEGQFMSVNEAAAFLELPDGKVLLSQHRKQFIAAPPTYIFRGFSFAFKKGSPIATDVSRDILNLYEDGTLKSLEENRFAYSSESSAYDAYLRDILNLSGDGVAFDYQTDFRFSRDSDSLAIHSFWGLYLIFGVTSTICFLFFLINLIRSYCCDQDETEDSLPP
ncbi:hypothetical protein CRYUN_Cryun34aG0033600 [Craigia yunnanensis]